MQRLLDILLSGLAILALSPLLIPVIIILRFTGEGEIFYGQMRVGRGGREFPVLKFATMLKNSPNIGAGSMTLKDDPRVLPVGRVLRKTKVNELPQLFNVFMGQMSLIGPRPLTRDQFDAFPDDAKTIVTQVRPGLSGLGPVVFRDEEALLEEAADPKAFHQNVITPYKGRLEAWFVQNTGFTAYPVLIALTLWVVVFPGSKLVWRVFPSMPTPPAELSTLTG